MKNISFLSIVLTIFSIFLFWSPQYAEAACTVNSATFRTPGFSVTGWASDSNPPYVYVDVQTSGCTGSSNSFEFSITELDDDEGLNNANDDDLNNSGIDNMDVIVSAPNFSLAFKAGEEECEVSDDPDCNYYMRFNDLVLGGVNDFSALPAGSKRSFDCDGGCSMNWTYLGQVSYGSSWTSGGPDGSDGTSGGPDGSDGTSGGPTGSDGTSGGPNGSNVTDNSETISIQINNPLTGVNSIMQFIKKILDLAVTIGIPILALAIIYSGYLFVTARGDSKQIGTAKAAFFNAVLGGGILLGAWVIAQAIENTIGELTASIITYLI